MERKTKNKIIFCLTLFFVIAAGFLISLAFSTKIETRLGFRPQDAKALEDYKFRVDFIDVGQGSSCYITLPNGKNMLIDAGTNSSEGALVKYLNKRGVSAIDYFVITHSDNDHTGGADAVFENFEVKEIFRPFILSNSKNYAADNDPLIFYKDELSEDEVMCVSGDDYAKCISLMYAETYTQNGETYKSTITISSEEVAIMADEVLFRMWWPQTRSEAADSRQFEGERQTGGKPTQKCSKTNDYSPVMTFEFLSVKMVITGDASDKVEKSLLSSLSAANKEFFANCDIYVAGHHGSNSSSCEDFLKLLMPKTIVVQNGKSSTHPHPDFVARAQSVWSDAMKSGTILQTYKNGDISFYFNEENGSVEQSVNYAGDANQIVQKWWQVVVCAISVAAVLLLVPLIPKKKKKRSSRKAKRMR